MSVSDFRKVSKTIFSINKLLNDNYKHFIQYSTTRINTPYLITSIQFKIEELDINDKNLFIKFIDYKEFIIENGLLELIPFIRVFTNLELKKCLESRTKLLLLKELNLDKKEVGLEVINKNNNNIYLLFSAYIANNLLKNKGICNVFSEKVTNFYESNTHIVENLNPVMIYLGFITQDGSFLTNISIIINTLMKKDVIHSRSLQREYSCNFTEHLESKSQSNDFTLVENNIVKEEKSPILTWSFKYFWKSLTSWGDKNETEKKLTPKP